MAPEPRGSALWRRLRWVRPLQRQGIACRFRQACTRRGSRREVWVNQGGNTAFFAVLERMLRDGVFICDHSKFIIKKKRGTGYGKGHFLYHNPHLLPLR